MAEQVDRGEVLGTWSATITDLDDERFVLTAPLTITLEEYRGEFVASWPEVEAWGAGSTAEEATRNLKTAIARLCGELLSADPETLGKYPLQWKAALAAAVERVIFMDGFEVEQRRYRIERIDPLAIHAQLVEDGLIRPIERRAEDEQAWTDLDLASLVELRFGHILPEKLDQATRVRWQDRVLASDESFDDLHDDPHARYYWIVHNGLDVGTIGLSTVVFDGPQSLEISSLYVRRGVRRQGIAKSLLQAINARVVEAARDFRWPGHGLRIPTFWVWPSALRFYMAIGMSVMNWKHSLVMGWRSDLPAYRIEITPSAARFSIAVHGAVDLDEFEPIFAAARGRSILELQGREDEGLQYIAKGTFILALALRGWPLIRSAEAWARRSHSLDFGHSEGLAEKIRRWEAIALREGFIVQSPRIPGLPARLERQGWRARGRRPKRPRKVVDP